MSWLILIIIKWLYHCHRRCCCCGQHICNVSRQRLVSRHPKTVREGMKTKDCVSPSLRTENQNENGYDIQQKAGYYLKYWKLKLIKKCSAVSKLFKMFCRNIKCIYFNMKLHSLVYQMWEKSRNTPYENIKKKMF